MTIHTAASTRLRAPNLGKQRGFTLIEMLISITIGLGILAGLVGVLATNSSNSRSNDQTSELMTNGRYALNSMKQELREAGFRGYTWAEPGTPGPWAAPADASGCYEAGASAGAFVSNIRQGVWGVNDAAASPFAANCIPAASFASGTDVLVVRRLAVRPTATGDLAANVVYFHTTYERGQVFRSTAVPVPPDYGASRPLASFAVQVYVYYISPFTVSATEVPLVPALFRMALQSDGNMQRELVASGIEQMQVQYGQSTTTPNTKYLNANELAGSSSDPSAGEWEQVNSVRIWLLARNAKPEPGLVNSTTYPMGDNPFVAPGDNFRRQLFSTVVQLRN
jgi:type IV pilus assembly protein PilW